MQFGFGKVVALLLLVQLVLAPMGFAQEVPAGPQPVMENVFFNVVWGSVMGGLLATSVAIIGSEVKSSPDDVSDKVFEGLTWGGVLGLGLGIWLVTTGISFHPEQSLFFGENAPPQAPLFAAPRLPPIVFETRREGSFRISGFRATVLNLKF